VLVAALNTLFYDRTLITERHPAVSGPAAVSAAATTVTRSPL
jgi:hypothetical protein